jgi:class 3 adenylate cyclase
MTHEYHYTWIYDLKSSPEALWPLVSDTNRFNRDTGQPPMKLLGIQNGVKRVQYKIPFYRVEWEEEPFEWTYPYRFGILRRFRSGPLSEMRVDCRIERREPTGSRLTYNVWAKPNGLLGYPAIVIGIGMVGARRFEKAFRTYDDILLRGDLMPAIGRRKNLSSAGRGRLEVQIERLRDQGVDAPILLHINDYLNHADDLSIQRMRPYALADRWDLPRRDVLEAFLRATRLGMLDMYWDILCPECRGVTEDFSRLNDLQARSHCNTCQIDFTANFDHNVEVVFRPNPSVREVDATVEFCVGSPQRQPHVIFSYIVPAREELPFITILSPGRHTMRANGLGGSQALLAHKDGPAWMDFRANESGWPAELTEIGLTPKINLINETDQARTFELRRTAWSDQAATAADVTILQVFRDLFSNEVLRPGEEISVGSVTLMFTDLRGSTKLYRQIGDAPAFGRVREHFEILERVVRAEGGSIIKTMGDSVMAAFRRPAPALRAILEIQRQIAGSGTPPLRLKAGIHHGPCIVVNLNDRMDYFGSTVNIAARLPGFSSGGEAVISEPIRHDPEAQEFFEKNIQPNTLSRFQAEIRGYDEPFELWRMKM